MPGSCGGFTASGPCVLAVNHSHGCGSVVELSKRWCVRYLLGAQQYIRCGKATAEGPCMWPELHVGADCAGQAEVQRLMSLVRITIDSPPSYAPRVQARLVPASTVHVLLFPAPEEGIDAGFTVGPFKDRAEAKGYVIRFRQVTGRTNAYAEIKDDFYDPEALIAQLTAPDEDEEQSKARAKDRAVWDAHGAMVQARRNGQKL